MWAALLYDFCSSCCPSLFFAACFNTPPGPLTYMAETCCASSSWLTGPDFRLFFSSWLHAFFRFIFFFRFLCLAFLSGRSPPAPACSCGISGWALHTSSKRREYLDCWFADFFTDHMCSEEMPVCNKRIGPSILAWKRFYYKKNLTNPKKHSHWIIGWDWNATALETIDSCRFVDICISNTGNAHTIRNFFRLEIRNGIFT